MPPTEKKYQRDCCNGQLYLDENGIHLLTRKKGDIRTVRQFR